MNKIRDKLNNRYNAIKNSSSDRNFYENVYYYFDFIMNSSPLLKIWNESKQEYIETQHEINEEVKEYMEKMKESSDSEYLEFTNEDFEKKIETKYKRMKKYEWSLYAIGDVLHAKFYTLLDGYMMNDKTTDLEQPNIVLVLMKGIDYMKEHKNLDEDEIERLKGIAKWREEHEPDIERFHNLLIKEVEELDKTDLINKSDLKFDKDESELIIGDKKVEVTLRQSPPVDHYILNYIFNKNTSLEHKAYYGDIIQSEFFNEDYDYKSLRRACKRLNEKVLNQVNIKNFLIYTTGKDGNVRINPDYI